MSGLYTAIIELQNLKHQLENCARYSDKEIDSLLGIRRQSVEKQLDLGELLIAHGQQRMDPGDHGYQTILKIFKMCPDIEKIVDLGSGYGRIVITASLYGIPAIGIELINKRVQEAESVRCRLGLNNIRFIHGDVAKIDTPIASHYCVMNSFSHSILPSIIEKLKEISERRKITIISISGSNEFFGNVSWLKNAFPSSEADLGLQVFHSINH